MFGPQLLKLIEKLQSMTMAELAHLKKMEVKQASYIAEEKDPLVTLYQQCIAKISNDEETRNILKVWDKFDLLKAKVAEFAELNAEHEIVIKRVLGAHSRFVDMIQENMLDIEKPVNSYNNYGQIVNKKQHFQGSVGVSLNTLDQNF